MQDDKPLSGRAETLIYQLLQQLIDEREHYELGAGQWRFSVDFTYQHFTGTERGIILHGLGFYPTENGRPKANLQVVE